MNDLKYHVAQPSNKKASYTSNDNVRFILSAQNRNLLNDTVRLVGNVQVVNNAIGVDVKYDNFVGCHSFISDVVVKSTLLGNLEVLNAYNNMSAVVNKTTMMYNDAFNAKMICQGVVPMDKMSASLLFGEVPFNQTDNDPTDPPTDVVPMSFYLRPKICLNKMDVASLPFARVGDLEVLITLEVDQKALFGNPQIGSDFTYSITDLRILYNTIPDNGQYLQAYPMNVSSYFKTTINSSLANFSTKTSVKNALSFYCCAIPANVENIPLENSFQLYQIPNIKQLSFNYNDSATASQITYDFGEDNREEILTNFIEAVKMSDSNGGSMAGNNVYLAANNGWGMGLKFNQAIDLSVNKLSVDIESDINNTNPFTLYFFFNGLVAV
jgi:hypothetical protein